MKRSVLRTLQFAFSCKQWFTFRLTRAGQLVAASIVISAMFGVNTHANLAHQIFCFLAVLACIAIVAGRRLDVRLSLSRGLPRHGTVGQLFSYRVWVTNDTGKPITDLVIREIVDAQESLPHEKWLSYWKRRNKHLQLPPMGLASIERLEGNDRRDISITIEPKIRGRIDFNGIAVNRSDPLGLYHSQTEVKLAGRVLVLPKLYKLPSVVLPGKRHFQPGGVALAATVGDSEEFVALRDYRPGDPLRRIHWKSWAKIGKPVVKEYQEEFFVRHALVLDTFHTSAKDRLFEEAVSLAASFVSARENETLLDLMFVGLEAHCFTCGRGLTNTDKMLEILSGVSICYDQSFEALLPLVLQRTAQLSACICVFLSWEEDRQKLVGMLRRLNVPVEVFVLVENGQVDNEDLGPMQDQPHRFHALSSGRVQEELDRL